MRKADFKANIKKIEIANKVLAEGWDQSIRVILDNIELTNENLLELRHFKPNEPVMVIITPVQPGLFDDQENYQEMPRYQTGETGVMYVAEKQNDQSDSG